MVRAISQQRLALQTLQVFQNSPPLSPSPLAAHSGRYAGCSLQSASAPSPAAGREAQAAHAVSGAQSYQELVNMDLLPLQDVMAGVAEPAASSAGGADEQRRRPGSLQAAVAAAVAEVSAASGGMMAQPVDESMLMLVPLEAPGMPQQGGLTHKVCRMCQQEKPAAEYATDTRSIDGFALFCRPCSGQQVSKRVRPQTPPAVAEKSCLRCGATKPAGEFYRDTTKPDGLRARCKACDSQFHVDRRKRLPLTEEPTVSHKVCRKCQLEKTAADFCRKKERSDGLDSYCKACNAQATAERFKRRQPVLEPKVAEKHCAMCNETKPSDQFPQKRMSSDGLHSYCKACYTKRERTRKQNMRVQGPTVASKVCAQCGEEKPAADFPVNRYCAGGLMRHCRMCKASLDAESRKRKQFDNSEADNAAPIAN